MPAILQQIIKRILSIEEVLVKKNQLLFLKLVGKVLSMGKMEMEVRNRRGCLIGQKWLRDGSGLRRVEDTSKMSVSLREGL